MERFVRRLMDREDGLAMVSAIIVSFLVVAFGVALVQLSLHNSESSAVNRGRVEAVNAAEAGIDVVYSQMERYGFAHCASGRSCCSSRCCLRPRRTPTFSCGRVPYSMAEATRVRTSRYKSAAIASWLWAARRPLPTRARLICAG